ncbi:hypothetical protein MKW94_030140 [Papaver nudicaule]|uniref:pectinesterase n=1 Tax=Papaver nudicaule TaxID=74823 RepID=A0AA41SL81_PAPNU|nr:hypothetical protein [Papaver nudicaule]
MSSQSRSFSMLHLALLFLICLDIVAAYDCYPRKVAYTINVSNLPGAAINYTTVQAAINSIHEGNNQWIRVLVQPGVHMEQVVVDKPCILLEGHSLSDTIIVFDSHQQLNTSQTFYVKKAAKNFIAKSISFKDTIWDLSGHHYFFECHIEGQVDFICGNGQSIYQNCIINVLGNGYITAQKREAEEETTGFVFNKGLVIGQGSTYLGRAWGSHSCAIFHSTSFNTFIVPQGWSAWFIGQKIAFFQSQTFFFFFFYLTPKNMTIQELQSFTQLSYIDSESPRGWLSRQPID